MSILYSHRLAWFDRHIGHAISGAHEVTFKFLIQDFDLTQPLAGGGTNPARHERTRRPSMMLCQRRVIHSQCDQGVPIAGFFHWNTADERWHFPRHFIQPTKHDLLSGGLHSSALQYLT